jgi:hypothetical protein
MALFEKLGARRRLVEVFWGVDGIERGDVVVNDDVVVCRVFAIARPVPRW